MFYDRNPKSMRTVPGVLRFGLAAPCRARSAQDPQQDPQPRGPESLVFNRFLKDFGPAVYPGSRPRARIPGLGFRRIVGGFPGF